MEEQTHTVILKGGRDSKKEEYAGCQLMWLKLADPRIPDDGGKPKYEVELWNLCKEDIALLKTLDPPFTPLDGAKRVDQKGNSLEKKGIYCTPRSTLPVVVYDSGDPDLDQKPKPMALEQVRLVYAESRGHVKVHSFAYNKGGNKGVGLGLTSVMITKIVKDKREESPFEAVKGGYIAPDLNETADDVPF